jgi:hypothetical protein
MPRRVISGVLQGDFVCGYGLNSPKVQDAERWAALLDRYFVREQESRCTIGELNQVHRPIQIANLAQNSGLLAKSGAPFVVAHWFKQSAMPARHFSRFALAHHFSTSFGQSSPANLIHRVHRRYT